MPSADAIVTRSGPISVPLEYTVPATEEIVPLTMRAHFDGTSAAGAFLPALQIVSQNGAIVATATTADSVAAGASADVSWFPGFLEAAAATPSATAAPFAVVSAATNSFPSHNSATTSYGDLSNGNFWTSDSTILDSVISPGAPYPVGVNLPTIKVPGTYALWLGATFDDAADPVTDPTAVPINLDFNANEQGGALGGNDSALLVGATGGLQGPIYGHTLGTHTPGTGWSVWYYDRLGAYSIGTRAPTPITIGGWQNSGHTLEMVWSMYIVQIGTTNMFA